MLTPTDFLDDSEREIIHNIAPGEGNRPQSISTFEINHLTVMFQY